MNAIPIEKKGLSIAQQLQQAAKRHDADNTVVLVLKHTDVDALIAAISDQEKPLAPALKKLCEIARELPEGLKADWKGTNHFELCIPQNKEEYWWLDKDDIWALVTGVWEVTLDGNEDKDEQTVKKRVGLLLDLAAAVSAALPDLKELEEA